MVSAPAGLRIVWSGFEAWPGHCVVLLGKNFTLRVTLFTKVSKRVTTNLMLEVNLAMDYYPGVGMHYS